MTWLLDAIPTPADSSGQTTSDSLQFESTESTDLPMNPGRNPGGNNLQWSDST